MSTENNKSATFSIESVRRLARVMLVRGVRLYTANTPIARGRYRVFLVAQSLLRELPGDLPVHLPDGRRFVVNLATGMQSTVFFLGEYERALTFFVEKLIREGDVCLDVGANFGWYASIFRKHCGETGEVHAFEPVPPTFDELERNHLANGAPRNVYLNNFALGAKHDTFRINLFRGLPTGHASLSDQGRTDAVAFDCKVETLESYIESHKLRDVSFLKVDIEGSEMFFLEGAGALFRQPVPPMFLMEMALEQTRNFGYRPNDLIEFLRKHADYRFFKIDEIAFRLIEIEKFDEDDIGANVLCIPADHCLDRFEAIAQYVDPLNRA